MEFLRILLAIMGCWIWTTEKTGRGARTGRISQRAWPRSPAPNPGFARGSGAVQSRPPSAKGTSRRLRREPMSVPLNVDLFPGM